MSQCTSD